jgi:hypothetical protein
MVARESYVTSFANNKACHYWGLAATSSTIAHYIALIGERGTIKATSILPYLSTINGIFRDHGAEHVA